jgi:hypothetical protein
MPWEFVKMMRFISSAGRFFIVVPSLDFIEVIKGFGVVRVFRPVERRVAILSDHTLSELSADLLAVDQGPVGADVDDNTLHTIHLRRLRA